MFALRSWLRTPRLALTLLACIAVSIGGTATVFLALLASAFLPLTLTLLACWLPARRPPALIL